MDHSAARPLGYSIGRPPDTADRPAPMPAGVRAIVRIVGVRAVVRVLVRSALWLAVLRLLILSVLRSRRTLRRILAAMIAVIRAILRLARLARRIRLARLALVGLAVWPFHWPSFGLLIVTP